MFDEKLISAVCLILACLFMFKLNCAKTKLPSDTEIKQNEMLDITGLIKDIRTPIKTDKLVLKASYKKGEFDSHFVEFEPLLMLKAL